MHPRIPRPLLIPLLVLATITGGCERGPDATLTAEIQRLNSELEETRLRLDSAEKVNAAKRAQPVAPAALETSASKPPQTTADSIQKDDQISALQVELAEIKKRDAFVFAAASATLRSGTAGAALDRYERFLKDFPNSPLAADADRAVTELTAAAQREARSRATLVDPRRALREALEHFNDGTVTVQEIAPLLKIRSAADVVKLLGPPNQTYRDGKEIGYTDRVIDSSTGNKGTLVVGFDADSVATLRVGYLGKPIKP